MSKTNILIYDRDAELNLEFFCKYKNLELVPIDEFKQYATSNWDKIGEIMDATSRKSVYTAFSKVDKPSIFYKEIPYVIYKNKKVIALYDLKIYKYCKNSENFDEITLNKFCKQLEIVESVLELVCSSYIDFLEKELDELDKNTIININNIVNKNDSDYYFVVDKKDNKIVPDGKTLDLNSLMLLKELKSIFMHQI